VVDLDKKKADFKKSAARLVLVGSFFD